MAQLTRAAGEVLNTLFETPGGAVIAKVPCRIQVPYRFLTLGLASVGVTVFTVGHFALILDDGRYAVCNVNAMMELDPTTTRVVTIRDVDYQEFIFDEGQTIIKNTNLVKRPDYLFNIVDEFIFKGKVPWYLNYDDIGTIFDTAARHAGSDVGDSLEAIELLVSIIGRPAAELKTYVRHTGNSDKDFMQPSLAYVPLKSRFYSVSTTINKLVGSYLSEGITSALVSPPTTINTVERILRA